jgi:ABC-type uncharacterized transport system involved in gliding motility auxiliary subunit
MGELFFTAALIDVLNPKPLVAYFLTGHGEHRIDSGDEIMGYLKLASFFQQNSIRTEPLSLAGTNPVPADCSLLVIAGPRAAIPESELNKIDQYLIQGGRLFALFNSVAIDRDTGLEKLLGTWGVQVGKDIVVDPGQSTAAGLGELIVMAYNDKHPMINPMVGFGLDLVQPRWISRMSPRSQAADAPRVDQVAFTSPNAFAAGDPGHKQQIPLIVVVEKGAIQGRVTEKGTTRMVVVGDSICLGNRQLDLLANRDFAGYAMNWLLDRTELLSGPGARPITEYTLKMTNLQLQQAQLALLAGMPGTVLVLGGLVWLRRRK